MADAVTVYPFYYQTNGSRNYGVHLTNISDGTGESNVVKIDKSAIKDSNGVEPALIKIVAIRWAVQGMNYVKLSTDHTTDDTLFVLTGTGYDNFERLGDLSDPNSAGGTGDLLLTTSGAVSGGSYDITIELEL